MRTPIAVTSPEDHPLIPGMRTAVDSDGVVYAIDGDRGAKLKPFFVAARTSGKRHLLVSPEGPHHAVEWSDFEDALTGYAVTHREGLLDPKDAPDGDRAIAILGAITPASQCSQGSASRPSGASRSPNSAGWMLPRPPHASQGIRSR